MDAMKHTKGKWGVYDPRVTATGTEKRILVVHPDKDRVLANCSQGYVSNKGGIPFDERMANAHIMAAAPELYECLLELVDIIDDPDARSEIDSFTTQPAVAALAKARGD